MILTTFLSENPLCLVWRLILSVMVQGGEVFDELDIESLDRFLLQLVRFVTDILLVWGMFRTITRPPCALVRDTRSGYSPAMEHTNISDLSLTQVGLLGTRTIPGNRPRNSLAQAREDLTQTRLSVV